MMTQTCRGCGQPLAAGVSFCPNCGVRTEGNGAGAVQNLTQPAATEQATTPIATQPTAVPAAPTAPLPVPPATGLGLSSKWIVGGAIAAVLIAGIVGFLGAHHPVDTGQLVADGPITAEGGGTIPFDNGGKVQAPPGAVSKTEHITVHKTYVQREVRIGSTTYPPGTFTLFIFGPNITFLRPVTIILPLPAGAVAGRIYVLFNGRLIFLQQRPNQGGFVIFTVTGFNAGQLVGVRG